MLKSIKVPMTLVRVGSVVLIIIAFLYVYLGYPYVSKGLFASNLDAGVSGEVRAAYLGFSLHLFFIAYLLLDSSRRSNPRKLIMLLCGLIVFVDSFNSHTITSSECNRHLTPSYGRQFSP